VYSIVVNSTGGYKLGIPLWALWLWACNSVQYSVAYSAPVVCGMKNLGIIQE